MPLTRVHTFANKTIVDGSELDAEFDNIINHHTAGHTTADMHASAALLNAQLANKYEHMAVTLHVTTGEYGAAWPGGNAVMDVKPVPGLTGDSPWTVTDIHWACSDTGGGAGTFRIQYGYYNAGAWTAIGWVCATTTMSNAVGADDANSGAVTPTGTTYDLAVGATPRFLGLISTGADATTLTGGSNADHVTAICYMRRELASS